MTRHRSFGDNWGRGRSGGEVDTPSLDPWALGIGGSIVAMAVSSLLDDRTTLHHPWWSVLVGAALVTCVFVVSRTVQRLFAVDGERSTELDDRRAQAVQAPPSEPEGPGSADGERYFDN